MPASSAELRIALRSCRAIRPHVYRIAWEITNPTERSIRVDESWVPHGRFHSPRKRYDPPLEARAGGRVRITHDVAYRPLRDPELHNAFVVTRLRRNGERCRLFAQLLVVASSADDVRPQFVRVTQSSAGEPL